MDSPPGDTNMPKPASEVMPTRISRIPNLPSSRRPLSYTATSTGSPRANAITPPLRNTRSPAAGSKIPLPPSTSSHTPVPGATRPRSAFEASRSALPRAMGARETQTMRSSANLEYTNAHLRFGLNKPLPSPPIAQVMDPNSPPKAQRTLVDAEVGTLSETQWPIIRPENVSPSETILTTDEKGMQQQQQQQSNMFNSLAAVHNTNVPVENSASRSSSTFDVQAERDISPGYEQTTSVRDDDIHHKTESRRLSSNNPYAKQFHAVSPKADVAISSPLAHKPSTPFLLSVPPRISSKRNSVPLSRHEQTDLPLRAASSNSREVASERTAFDSNEQENGEPQPTESDALSTDTLPMIAVSPSVDTSIRHDHKDMRNDVCLEEDDERNDLYEDAMVASESSPFITYDWSFDPSTGWWTKRIPTRSDRPDSGMFLRIHEHADAIMYGDPDNMPEDLPEEKPGRVSVSQSIGTLAGRLSKQAMASMVSINNSSKRTPDVITTVSPNASPAVISPIRSMRPARQTSTALSPGRMSIPTAASVLPVEDTIGFAEALLMEPDMNVSGASPVLPAEDAIGFSEALLMEPITRVDVTTNATFAKASKKKSIMIKSPRRPTRNSGRFMAATASSARKTIERVSSREATLRASASGTVPPSQPGKGSSRLTRIKETLRADMRAPHVPPPYQPPPPPKAVGAPGEVEKSTMRLRAKQSFRKLFSKAHVPEDVPEVPSVAMYERVFIPHDMAETVNGILDTVSPMPANSLEGEKSLEIAESVVRLGELAKEVKNGQEKLRQIARENEVRRGELAMEKELLGSLLEYDFQDEGLKGLMARLKGFKIVTEH